MHQHCPSADIDKGNVRIHSLSFYPVTDHFFGFITRISTTIALNLVHYAALDKKQLIKGQQNEVRNSLIRHCIPYVIPNIKTQLTYTVNTI